MVHIKAKIKKWGNSAGVVVPHGVLDTQHLRIGDEVHITIQKQNKNALAKTFGRLRVRKPTQKILKDIDEALDSD